MNERIIAFVLIALLFSFAVVAFIFGDFFYCLAFLVTLAAVFYFVDPRDGL